MTGDTIQRHTVADLARLLRVGKDKVRGWIRRGELMAVNTSTTRCGRPRYVVLPDALASFLRGRAAADPPPPPRRSKKTRAVDYYPD